MKNLILEGFMGCGKSRIAKALGDDTGMKVIDTDELIEKEQKRAISGIFASDGEEAFRDMETALLRKLQNDTKNCIISLGGGMPVREENRRILKDLGTVVYLKADREVLIGRLERGVEKRPMLSGHDLEKRVDELLAARQDLYVDAADIIIDIGEDDPDTISLRIRKELGL